MELTGEHTFNAPRERVWNLLLDPAVLQASLPGCERLEQIGEDEYAATMKIGVAMIKGTFNGKVKITDKQEPERYTMAVEGSGPQGQVSGVGTLELIDQGGKHWCATKATPTCAARSRGSAHGWYSRPQK